MRAIKPESPKKSNKENNYGETPLSIKVKCISGKTINLEAEGTYKILPSIRLINELKEKAEGGRIIFNVCRRALKTPLEKRRRRY